MKAYSLTFFLSIFLLLGFHHKISATQVSGGEIYIFNVDANPCDDVDQVQVIATLVKQCGPNVSDVNPTLDITFTPNCNDPNINVPSPTASLFSDETHGGVYFKNLPLSEHPCVISTKDCDLEVFYYKTGVIDLPRCDWTISWEEDFRPVNSQNLIEPDINSIHITSDYNNSRGCRTVTDPDNPNDVYTFEARNNTPTYSEPVPVAEFCVGKEFNYYIGASDMDGDDLEYEIISARGAGGVPIGFLPPYPPTSPFPSIGPVIFDEENGILTFTPEMPFESTVVFKISEYRDSVAVDPNTGYLTSTKVLMSTTIRDVRFVFESECTDEVIEFFNKEPDPFDEDPTPHPDSLIANRLEYDCAPTQLEIVLSHPIQCSSIEPHGTDFRIVKGSVEKPEELFAIDAAFPDPNVNYFCRGDSTKNIIITLHKQLGPGRYKLFLKTGDDFNTLKTKCGIEVDEFMEFDIVINNKTTNLDFIMEDISACRPQNDAPIAKVPKVMPGSFYTWTYEGEVIDDQEPGRLDSARTLEVDSAGEWTAEINYLGCTYKDTFDVTIYENIPLPEIPDFDLCASEPYPLIDTLREFFELPQNEGKEVKEFTWTLYSVKNPEGEVIGRLDTLQTVVPGRYIVSVFVDHCILTEEFRIKRRTRLNVEIGDDIILCEGEDITLTSEEDFQAISDEYLYQWYNGEEMIQESTSRSLYIDETGEYILEVYKPIPTDPENYYCSGTDTVEVLIVDSLKQPQPLCTSISYHEGQVFEWPPIENAEYYEVNEIRESGESGWIEAVNEDSSSSHRSTFDVKFLEVRAANDEVDESYHCKFSRVNVAEQCEVIIEAPNVFTPNGDGNNDFLMFNLLEIFPGSSLQVFNRWGKKVFESSDYRNDWDGEDQDAGTYFYILDINDDGHELQKGTFTLLK